MSGIPSKTMDSINDREYESQKSPVKEKKVPGIDIPPRDSDHEVTFRMDNDKQPNESSIKANNAN